jgi:uncharacterized protein
MAHCIAWCDIPVTDIDRAIRFYSALTAQTIQKQEYPGFVIGMLPGSGSDVTGCLYVTGADNKPSAAGPLVYFNCSGRLDDAISTVEPNGGKILTPREQIGEHGFRAVVLDSEGNRIALHSN